MNRYQFYLKNRSTRILRLTLEPMSEDYLINSGDSCDIVIVGEPTGKYILEIFNVEDQIIVFGPAHTTMSVFVEDQEIEPKFLP